MKIAELLVSLLLVVTGLGLSYAYASEAREMFSFWWAALAVVNAATAAIKGVSIYMERSYAPF